MKSRYFFVKKFSSILLSLLLSVVLTLSPSAALLGDVDFNGKVTASDARMILRVSAQLEKFDTRRIKAADMNGDGKISALDARMALRISASLSPTVTYRDETTKTTEKQTETKKNTTEKNTTGKNVSKKIPAAKPKFTSGEIPAYKGNPSVEINDNKPFFTYSEIISESYEYYSDLDSLGRCGYTAASIGKDLMPTEERGSIGMVKPSGWHTVKYDIVDGKYLYNRCHLIGYQLTGENANVNNLITGTRYMNVEGMLPYEETVSDYIKDTGNHVMYRSTPIFKGSDLLARGVLLEGYSVEDKGKGIDFCVFCYNVQPGVSINYSTGDSSLIGKAIVTTATSSATKQTTESTTSHQQKNADYILNKSTKKFHRTNCAEAEKIKASNKEYYKGGRQTLIDEGYSPCKRCNP